MEVQKLAIELYYGSDEKTFSELDCETKIEGEGVRIRFEDFIEKDIEELRALLTQDEFAQMVAALSIRSKVFGQNIYLKSQSGESLCYCWKTLKGLGKTILIIAAGEKQPTLYRTQVIGLISGLKTIDSRNVSSEVNSGVQSWSLRETESSVILASETKLVTIAIFRITSALESLFEVEKLNYHFLTPTGDTIRTLLIKGQEVMLSQEEGSSNIEIIIPKNLDPVDLETIKSRIEKIRFWI